MPPDDEADIFDSGSAAPTPASSDNEVVSRVINDLQHDGGRSHPGMTPVPPAREAPSAPSDGVEDRSTAGLLKALLDERQGRQDAARERDDLKRWREEQERLRKAEEKPFDQLLFEQPKDAVSGFVDERLQPLQSRLQTMQMDFDFKLARMQHGEVFDNAFREWYSAVADPNRPNPDLYFHIARSPNPGETLVRWFEQASFMKDVGDDPKTYRQRIEAETLARYGLAPDGSPVAPQGSRPTEAPRAANGQFTARHEVRLPTATSRLGRAGSGVPEGAEDGSEEAIFDAGRPSRRR